MATDLELTSGGRGVVLPDGADTADMDAGAVTTRAGAPGEGGTSPGAAALTEPGAVETVAVRSYVPEHTTMPEFTAKAVVLGVLMAVVLGAANAYLGLRAGMTISAAFPAAVVAIAAFRLPFMRGSILEQNLARTTASVGEALAAGAIFTIPAFVMVNMGGERLWTEFRYMEVTALVLVGGLLGIFFVILLRRTLVNDSSLPFPEGKACYEIVRSGQRGETGARWVFGAMGVGMLIELLKNYRGFGIIKEEVHRFITFPQSFIQHFNMQRQPIGGMAHEGGMLIYSPSASPALMGVGYIIGPRIASINLAGGVFAWLVFIPLSMFLNPGLRDGLAAAGTGAVVDYLTLAHTVWQNQVRPLAVGAMLVGSFYTLWGLRNSLGRTFRAMRGARDGSSHGGASGSAGAVAGAPAVKAGEGRLVKDLNLRIITISSLVVVVPMIFLFNYFTHSFWGAVLAAVVMTLVGFAFAAVGGWLVGIVGNSNQPVSGLTLSALIIAALLMVAVGIRGIGGVGAVLAIATVVCCVACMAGDMIQDLKVGQMIGGTPWKMEIAEIIGTVVMALVVVFPIIMLHEGNIAGGGIGIGGIELPAPQAGLMAQLATGIVGGEMPWGLIVMGMFFAFALILIKAPSPMLIAVGMYLPFYTTFAIFVGGAIKWTADMVARRRKLDKDRKMQTDNRGVLVASGFIAGEALTGVVLAGLVMVGLDSIATLVGGEGLWSTLSAHGGWLSLLVFAVVFYAFVVLPFRTRGDRG